MIELYERLKKLLDKPNLLNWDFPKDRNVLKFALHNCSWNLFLEKYAFLMYRRDEYNRDKDNRDKDMNKVPSGKPLALLVAAELSKKPNLSCVCKNKLRFLDNLSRLYSQRCRTVKLVNSTNISIHLGRASVLENVGLYAERVTGLPVIPGTALKGVLSTWSNWEENEKSGSLYADDIKVKKLRKDYDKDLASKIFATIHLMVQLRLDKLYRWRFPRTATRT
jgi:CRISPR/Cas system CMR subunit Cmr6 (Cas7 group RAMP superfamily)